MNRAVSKTSSWLELIAVTALLLSYLWLWQRRFDGDAIVCLALFLALTVSGHRRRGESARDLGFRLDNLGRSAGIVFSWVLPLALAVAVIGLFWDLHREWPIEGLGTRIALMPLFGLAQQYGLLGFYHRRFSEVLPGLWLPVAASAIVFSLFHAPNTPLTAMTFVIGVGSCWLYRKAPNLWILGLAHGLLSLTVAMLLAELLAFGLKVGSRLLH